MPVCNQKQVPALLACNAIPSEDPAYDSAYKEGKLEICGSLRRVHSSICDMQLHTYICIYGALMHMCRIDPILRLSDSFPAQLAMQTPCLSVYACWAGHGHT